MMESSTVVRRDSTNTGDWITVPNSFAAGGTRRKGYTVSIKNNELLNDSDRVYVCLNGAFNSDNDHHEDKTEFDITNLSDLITMGGAYTIQFRTRCGAKERRFVIESKLMGWHFESTQVIGNSPIGRSTFTTKVLPIDRDIDDITITYL